MRSVSFAAAVSILLTFSCTGKNDKNPVTLLLRRADYTELVKITGTVQAVENTAVMPPPNMFGQMTVLHLAQNGQYVKKGDTICTLSCPSLESMYKESLTSIENLEAALKKNEAENKLNMAMLEAQLSTSEAQEQISFLDSLKMKFVSDSQRKLLELEIKKAKIEKQKIEKKLAATRNIGETEIRQRKARILQAKAKTQNYEAQVNALTIIAGREGIVLRTESPKFSIIGSQGIGVLGGPVTEGSVLFLNTAVLQFPDLAKMQIISSVAEADFRKIEKDQKVNISIDAAGKIFTTGKVSRKSLASRSSEMYSDSKVKYYEIIIDIDSCDRMIKPGLSAECNIILAQIKDTLFVPTMSIFEKDSSRIVYVMDRKLFTPVRVETGTSGSSYTIIKSGLNGDEAIALTEPPYSLISRRKIKSGITTLSTK